MDIFFEYKKVEYRLYTNQVLNTETSANTDLIFDFDVQTSSQELTSIDSYINRCSKITEISSAKFAELKRKQVPGLTVSTEVYRISTSENKVKFQCMSNSRHYGWTPVIEKKNNIKAPNGKTIYANVSRATINTVSLDLKNNNFHTCDISRAGHTKHKNVRTNSKDNLRNNWIFELDRLIMKYVPITVKFNFLALYKLMFGVTDVNDSIGSFNDYLKKNNSEVSIFGEISLSRLVMGWYVVRNNIQIPKAISTHYVLNTHWLQKSEIKKFNGSITNMLAHKYNLDESDVLYLIEKFSGEQSFIRSMIMYRFVNKDRRFFEAVCGDQTADGLMTRLFLNTGLEYLRDLEGGFPADIKVNFAEYMPNGFLRTNSLEIDLFGTGVDAASFNIQKFSVNVRNFERLYKKKISGVMTVKELRYFSHYLEIMLTPKFMSENCTLVTPILDLKKSTFYYGRKRLVFKPINDYYDDTYGSPFRVGVYSGGDLLYVLDINMYKKLRPSASLPFFDVVRGEASTRNHRDKKLDECFVKGVNYYNKECKKYYFKINNENKLERYSINNFIK